ncbi:hypothetical protein RND81_11G193600 [Saponaria officinalis]|uniref:NB-ARC domain-containing protein n=1 Tax=Saponaria officinalis TaxID=3572 RepID=A0AAW1HN86_SAPOF
MAEPLVIWKSLERNLVKAEAASQPPLKEELRKLLGQVTRARGPVTDLEGRNHIHRTHANHAALHDHSDNLAVNDRHGLLEKLSTLLYQADDLLDQIMTRLCKAIREGNQREGNEREEHERENQSPLVRQVVHAMATCTQDVSVFLSQSNQLIFPRVMAGRVENIRKELENLVEQLLDEPDNQPRPRDFRHIGSVEPDQYTVTGRRNETKNIVNMLLQPHRYSKANVSVICMSGLPGVGKTALAKHIYEDQKIKSHFDLRMWISVSQIHDEKEIIRGIVDSCTSRRSNHQNSRDHQIDTNPFRDLLGCRSTSATTSSLQNNAHHNEIDMYERRLRREIREKLYLLILDDVSLSLREWQRLRDLLAGGARGSRILITTQSTEVADLVKTEFVEAEVCPLQGLSENHSWILFKRMALEKDAYLDKEMKQAGFEIVDICKYVPLSIKVAARFLQGKSREEWLSFTEGLRLSRNQGGDIMEHVLHLSYSDLPPRLRACFTYCSLFPDDFTFNKHDLISLWIAQGYVGLDVSPDVDPQDRISLEYAGEKYFMELSRRCFFEDVKIDDLKNILTCKMHRIVRKLASTFTAAVANVHVTDSGMIQIKDSTTKHVTVDCRSHSSLKLSPPILTDPSLRTLIFVKEPDCDIKMDTLMSNQLISTYRRLRVLDLHDLGVNELPDSIGDQIHLRYLDVSNNDGLVTLPKSFTRLCNLQTLKLNSCPQLKRLATDFGLLLSLKRFEVDKCESLTCMPLGLEKLTQLETLSRFVVGKGSSKKPATVGLEALSRLTMLRGRLAIHFTGDWMTNIPETKQGLSTKKNLVEVKISWAKRTSDAQVPLEEEILAHGVTLENLKPNKDLKILKIEGYKGNDFPSWANKEIMSSLPNLVIISIEGCGKCRYLPPFGELIHLEKLTLRHMANVLFVEDTASLQSQDLGSQEPAQERPFFPSLQELTLHNFYNLKGWQQEVASTEQPKTRSFPCLSKLRIWNCPKLISFPSFTGVPDLDLRNINHLLLTKRTKTEPQPENKVYTRNLQIKGCLDLKDFREVRYGLEGLPSLKHLVIDSCDALISLAYDVGKITTLERLEISSCEKLDLSKESETQRTVVQQAHRVSSFLWSPWRNLKSLRHLRLREIPKMETLPDGLRHVKTLKTMWISACQSLGSLPEWIGSLTALQHLRIESCRALKMLPEGLKDTISLMKVEIIECPELIERCREHKGEDWPKIKHARVLLHKSRRYGYV